MTSPRTALALCAVASLGAATPPDAPEHPLARHEFSAEHMGTTFRIVMYAADESFAARAVDAAFARVARLDSLFSDYRADSEIAALAETAGSGDAVTTSPELADVLAEADAWSRATDGAFDVTVGPLSRLWRWSANRVTLPDEERLAAARAAVGFASLVVDGRTVRLVKHGMSLDLGGIAKGYAADQALLVLQAHGIDVALVDAGGDLALGSPPPGEGGWIVALPGGRAVRLANGAIATSGDAQRFVVVDGVRYSHIVDPRTGLGVVNAPVVTVVAPDATTADVLASALTVLDTEAARSLVEGLDDVWVGVSKPESWTGGTLPVGAHLEEWRNGS